MLQPEIRLHIREICEARGLTLRVLQDETERSKSYWQRVWVGKAEVGHRALARLARVTQTPPYALVEYVEWPVPKPCTCPCHTSREEKL